MKDLSIVLGGIAGLFALYYGAEALVRGGRAIAIRARVSSLVIGLTLVAFGTSAPELFVSTWAAIEGLGDVCVGNVVGSNICNIALILGLTAIINPVAVNPLLFQRDVPLMLLASLATTVLCCVYGGMGIVAGIIFLAILVGYTLWSVADARGHDGHGEKFEMPLPIAVLATIGGLAALVLGAKLLLMSTMHLEKQFGVADEIIALTAVAIGTSLPELATSLVAAKRGEADIAIGNIIGSNIFNLLGILGFSACLAPFKIEGMCGIDFAFMLATALMLWPLMLWRKRLGLREGTVLLITYAIYLAILFHR